MKTIQNNIYKTHMKQNKNNILKTTLNYTKQHEINLK